MPNAPSGDATRPRQGLQRHFTDAHTTLDAIEPRLPQLPPRVGIRYALVRGWVYNSSGEPERARMLFLAAWEQARDADEDALAVDASHMLGIVASGEESLTWNLRALDLAQCSSESRVSRARNAGRDRSTSTSAGATSPRGVTPMRWRCSSGRWSLGGLTGRRRKSASPAGALAGHYARWGVQKRRWRCRKS